MVDRPPKEQLGVTVARNPKKAAARRGKTLSVLKQREVSNKKYYVDFDDFEQHPLDLDDGLYDPYDN